jgi:hypothetical protein
LVSLGHLLGHLSRAIIGLLFDRVSWSRALERSFASMSDPPRQAGAYEPPCS